MRKFIVFIILLFWPCIVQAGHYHWVENGIHYSVQTTIWKAIAQAATELSCQVFATTHSYEFVRHAQEALADDYADDFRYIRLDRTDKGIEARSYDIEILETAISAGMEVR